MFITQVIDVITWQQQRTVCSFSISSATQFAMLKDPFFFTFKLCCIPSIDSWAQTVYKVCLQLLPCQHTVPMGPKRCNSSKEVSLNVTKLYLEHTCPNFSFRGHILSCKDHGGPQSGGQTSERLHLLI